MGGSFTVFSHTADTGIDVAADSLTELFEWAARGMFSTMYDIDDREPDHQMTVAAKGTHVDELLVDVLADLLYLSEVEDVVPCTFRVDDISPTEVGLAVGVVASEPDSLIGPPIKAVTYHELSATQQPDGTWTARVVFDV